MLGYSQQNPKKKPGIRPLVILLLSTLITLTACRSLQNRAARRSYPYVVLVSLDTLHVNYTGPYNPAVEYTPNLDAFADRGVVFRHAYTRVPVTLPSHTTLLSGLSPEKHGVMANGDVVPPSVTTLAEIFKAAGYRTAAFISLGVLAKRFGLDQGFESYADPFDEEEGSWYRYAHEVFRSVRQWFEHNSLEPFFLWVHLSDPHEPYVPFGAPPDTRLAMDDRILGEWNLVSQEPVTFSFDLPPGRHRMEWTSLRGARSDDRPETCIRLELLGESREAVTPYLTSPLPETAEGMDMRPSLAWQLTNEESGPVKIDLQFSGRLIRPAPSDVLDNYRVEVEYADRYLGELEKLFESLGIGEDVLWVIVSDHGEGLFHHDCLGHAEYVFEDQLRILWLMRGAGVPEGRVVEDTAALMVDVPATLLDLVGLRAPDVSEGHSMVDCWNGGPCPALEPWWAYAIHHDSNRLTALAGYDWPYKWFWRRGEGRRAHLLAEDPWEERDLLEAPGDERPVEIKRLAESFRQQRRRVTRLLQFQRRMVDHEERLEMLRSLGYIDPR
jgi:arylsulfatase A-like enzyme